jgi:hypothetical protein
MANQADESEQDISKIICVRDSSGRIVITVGLIATVFFENPWAQATRQAIIEVADSYLNAFRDHLTWARHPKTGRMYPISSTRIRHPRELLMNSPEDESWEFAYFGGDVEASASEFSVQGYGSSNISKELGYFHLSLPLRWFVDREETFPEHILRVCERIKPVSGYGGIGIVESSSAMKRSDHQPLVRKLAERFPGLEIEANPVSCIHLGQGMKGVNWLTTLGDRWIDELGGLNYLRARLGESFFFYPYDGGIVIQAGPKPQIGDTNAGRWPEHYVTLAKVLKKIQIKNHYPFHFGGPGRLDYEASLAWLFRFDKK